MYICLQFFNMEPKIRHILIVFICSLLGFTISCTSSSDDTLNDKLSNYPELKPPFRISINQISGKDSIPDLLSDIKNKLVQNSQIQNPIMPFELSNKWIVCYRINTDRNFDLFVAYQKNNLDSRILALISTKKNQISEIISAVYVGLDNYSEISENIEFEEWSTMINTDLSLKIHKQYQRITALEIEKNDDFSEKVNTRKSKTEIEETYRIDDKGQIEFINKAVFSEPSVPKNELSYRAVIAFKISNEDDDPINDEWMINNVEIQNICTYQNILFIQAYDNFNQIIVSNDSGNIIDSLDISFITNKISKGYVMVQSKNDPSFIEFGDKNNILKAISNYFNIELLLDE